MIEIKTVICTFLFMVGPNQSRLAHVEGKVIDATKETWQVDFTEALERGGYPKGYDHSVRYINNNSCLVLDDNVTRGENEEAQSSK